MFAADKQEMFADLPPSISTSTIITPLNGTVVEIETKPIDLFTNPLVPFIEHWPS